MSPSPSLPAPLLLALLAVSACSDGPPSASQQALDYHQDAAALLDRYCTSCHTAGGIAPLALTDYGAVHSYAAAIKAAVQSGRMPPWMPSTAGVPLRYSRAMRPQ